jgi:uncharacterized Tic20 family protein
MADNPQVPPPAPAPAPPPSGANDEKTLAMLAHILGLVTNWLGPLILYLMANDKPFAKKQAQEALNFQITVLIGIIVGWLLAFIFVGFIVLPAVGIANLILSIMAAIAVNNGQDYRYPFALRLVK